MKLKPCPFCGEDKSVFCYSAAQIGMLDEDDPNYDNAVFEFAVCCDFHLGGCGATSGYRDTAEEAVEAWNRRAVNVMPVVHGKWIRHISETFPADSTMECDQCHEQLYIGSGDADNFCPNCGARMEVDSDA